MDKKIKQLDQEINTKWKDSGKVLQVETVIGDIYETNMEQVMHTLTADLKDDYKINYTDIDSIHIKVDRRKNISVIEEKIKEVILNILGSKELADKLFTYRTLDGMIVISRRR